MVELGVGVISMVGWLGGVGEPTQLEKISVEKASRMMNLTAETRENTVFNSLIIPWSLWVLYGLIFRFFRPPYARNVFLTKFTLTRDQVIL